MQQAAGSFRCHYAWTSSMRAPKHDVAGVWRRVGVPARMDGARTSSYMTECHSWGGVASDINTGSPSKCEFTEPSCLPEEREMPAAFAMWVIPGSGQRRRAGQTGNAKAEYLDVISHPESSPGQLLTHLGLSFVHSQWTFWKDLLLNSSAILQCQQTWCSEVANEAWPWQSFFIPPWGGVSQTPLERWKVLEHRGARLVPGRWEVQSWNVSSSSRMDCACLWGGRSGGVEANHHSLSCSARKHLTKPVRIEFLFCIAVNLPGWTKKHDTQLNLNFN